MRNGKKSRSETKPALLAAKLSNKEVPLARARAAVVQRGMFHHPLFVD
jgi:hypothetical protein